MSWLTNLFGRGAAPAPAPRAATQSAGGGTLIVTADQLADALRAGSLSGSGQAVNATSAMRVAAVYGCVRLLAGVPANMPLDIKKRIDARTRDDANDHALWTVFRRRPNRWQTPSQFKRMMTAHLKLRGNAYAMISRSRGDVKELIPLHPDRVEARQRDDLAMEYVYTRRDGRKIALRQDEVFHLVGLSLDGVTGVSVLTYARETIGLSLAMENHGAVTFKNGARPSVVLRHPKRLGPEGRENIRAGLEEYRAGGDSEGKALILEEDMQVEHLSMTAEDAQWIESRRFSRSDIAMFFGVPPHMIGDTEKSTSWGTGIEQQTQGFLAFSAEDDLVTWEETINARLLTADDEASHYARFNRASLVRGDIKARFEAYQIGRQIKVLSANDVRAMEDMNPVAGGDIYENPAISPDKPKDGGTK
jgi:HK97 family phage portal protein